VTRAHDIGLRVVRNEAGAVGFEVIVGGGLGRTPMLGRVIRDWLPQADLLPYVEAILGVYNQLGRRDNKYKARIKIAVHEMGLETLRDLVEARFLETRPEFSGVDQDVLARIAAFRAARLFVRKPIPEAPQGAGLPRLGRHQRDRAPRGRPRHRHHLLKAHGATPGDATADQMRVMADLADRYGYGELRISHQQNVILPHVHRADLPAVHAALRAAGLATANLGLISDIIACPGMDYCALATARSIPIAQEIALRFEALKIEHEVGPLRLNISGCINACGHHHVGHIGILGLERAGVETYQITLGGDPTETRPSASAPAPGSRPRRSWARWSASCWPISTCAGTRRRPSSRRSAASEWAVPDGALRPRGRRCGVRRGSSPSGARWPT
jgi:sulfite reductase (NADPH) hemoprotein beta-component